MKKVMLKMMIMMIMVQMNMILMVMMIMKDIFNYCSYLFLGFKISVSVVDYGRKQETKL